jgi:hypothetical protein
MHITAFSHRHIYYGEMLHLSVAMKRCGSNLGSKRSGSNLGSKRSGMRKSGAIHINGLILTHKLQICCDFRVWRNVGPLLDDTDPDCRREALETVLSTFKCASAGIASLASQDHATSSKTLTIVSDHLLHTHCWAPRVQSHMSLQIYRTLRK